MHGGDVGENAIFIFGLEERKAVGNQCFDEWVIWVCGESLGFKIVENLIGEGVDSF